VDRPAGRDVPQAGVKAVEAGCEASEVLELVEASLDSIAGFVERAVVRDDDFARSVGRNDCLHSGFGDPVPEGVAVIGLIGDESGAFDPVDHRRRGDDVMKLPAGDHEPQRAAQSVGQHMDLGGQSASGTPQRLIFGPPFPVAACWWARTRVVSRMRYWLSRSRIKASNTAPDPGFGLPRKPGVDGLPLSISLGKIVPTRARTHNPKDAVDELPVIPPRSAGVARLARQQVLHAFPLLV